MDTYQTEQHYEPRPGFLKIIWMMLYPWLVYQGISIVVSIPYMAVVTARHYAEISAMESLETVYGYVTELVYAHYLEISILSCLFTIPLLLLFRKRDRQREMRMGIFEKYEAVAPAAYGLSFACGLGASYGLNFLLDYSGLSQLFEEGYSTVAEILFSGSLWLQILSIAVLVPIVEELIFRGLVYKRLRWIMHPAAAMVTSAVYFGAFHGNWLQGIYAFGIGLLLAYCYEKYKSIWAPIGIHVAANLFSVLITAAESAGGLDFLYNDYAYLGSAIVLLIVFVVTLYLIITKIHPAKSETASQEYRPADEYFGNTPLEFPDGDGCGTKKEE